MKLALIKAPIAAPNTGIDCAATFCVTTTSNLAATALISRTNSGPEPWVSASLNWRALLVATNSAACLTALTVSPPAFASPITSAPEPCACNRKDEKSEVPSGWRTEPEMVPPSDFTILVVSSSSDWPKA